MENESLIKLLTETLNFYADEANYENLQISKDKGFQARFVIDLVKKNKETMSSMEKQYEDYNKRLEEDFSKSDALKIIDDLNNLTKQ